MQTVDHLERWENVQELKVLPPPFPSFFSCLLLTKRRPTQSYAIIVAEEKPVAELATAIEEAEEAGDSQFEEVKIEAKKTDGDVKQDEESDDEIEIVEPDEDDEDEKIEVPCVSFLPLASSCSS